MGPPLSLDRKTRRAAPVNSSPAVGHPADAGPCPAQGSRTLPHKANSIPVNGLPVLILTAPDRGTSFKNAPKTARYPRRCRDLVENPAQNSKVPFINRTNANLSKGLNHYNREMGKKIFEILKKAYVEYEDDDEVLERRKDR